MRGAWVPGVPFERAMVGVAVAAILSGAAAPAPLHAQDLPVTRLTLDNGMRFLVLPRPGAPTVSFVVRFDVGSANERPGETGVAHLLEHLLFKGSSSVGTTNWATERFYLDRVDAAADSLAALRVAGGGDDDGAADRADAEEARLLARVAALEDTARAFVAPNEWVQLLVEQGARGLNATTDVDATTYFVELPSNRVELWFALEADRMSDPVFREFYTERDVVAEERRLRLEDQAGGRLEEALLAAAYRVHPYGVPVIGHARDLGALTRARVRAYHERNYGPNNAVVAVVGDMDPDAMLAHAEHYFGRIPRRDEPAPVGRDEPPQTAPRRVHVSFDAERQVRLAWHTVTAGHPDAPALSVLASVLAGGTTSRLYKRLVLEDRSALAVFAGGGPGARFPGLMTISAAPLAPHDNAALEAAILEEVARLAAEPPSERELAAVRNQVEVGEVERLSSNLGLAFQLAGSETLFDDWRATFRATAALRAVTARDVSRVAAAYLRPDAVTVATLSREGAARGDAAPAGEGS